MKSNYTITKNSWNWHIVMNTFSESIQLDQIERFVLCLGFHVCIDENKQSEKEHIRHVRISGVEARLKVTKNYFEIILPKGSITLSKDTQIEWRKADYVKNRIEELQ